MIIQYNTKNTTSLFLIFRDFKLLSAGFTMLPPKLHSSIIHIYTWDLCLGPNQSFSYLLNFRKDHLVSKVSDN